MAFQELLRGDRPIFGIWSTLPGPLSVQLIAGAGVDYVVIDLQHGGASEADLVSMLPAITATGAYPLVRPRVNGKAEIGRALDLGAHGVVVPNVDDAAQAAAAAAACAYAPGGDRSYGRLAPGADEPACIVMIESAQGLAVVDEIVRTPGVHGVYVGPFDLALSLEVPPGDSAHPAIASAVDRVLAAAGAVGLPVGVHAVDGAAAARLRHQGCRLVTVGSDAAVMTAGVAAELAAAQRDEGAVRPDVG